MSLLIKYAPKNMDLSINPWLRIDLMAQLGLIRGLFEGPGKWNALKVLKKRGIDLSCEEVKIFDYYLLLTDEDVLVNTWFSLCN